MSERSMLLGDIVKTSEAVAATRARLRKVELLAACLRRLGGEEIRIGVAYLGGRLPQGTVGVGWASLRDLPPAAPSPTALALREVHAALSGMASAMGSGSQAARRALVSDLFGRATAAEQRFLTGLLLGELRQGALEGLMTDAIAAAASVPAPEVRRALMLVGDLGAVAEAALERGSAGLARFRLQLFRPIQPMLAQTATGLDDALHRIDPAAVEWKLDGARVQVHREGREVRAFTRNLADVTARLPELEEAARSLPIRSVILDGEAIALRPDGRPHPFQVTMGRFSTQLEPERLRAGLPLSAFFFDCLHLDGEDLLDRPGAERADALEASVPASLRVARGVPNGAEAAREILDASLALGHEGVVVKSLDAPYEAGRRGASWLKVKVAQTLDLVVLAAEWGHGRRQGWLSNLHLGARDPTRGGFLMLGKTFKGMTDQMLAWQTERLLALETRRDRFTVHVRPELVVEVAFDGVQTSPRYDSGVALRFARVKGYRTDKRPEEADTIETVRGIHARAEGGG